MQLKLSQRTIKRIDSYTFSTYNADYFEGIEDSEIYSLISYLLIKKENTCSQYMPKIMTHGL